MNLYEIKSGIPIPPRRKAIHRKNGDGFTAALRKLKVGDSMEISRVDQFSSADTAGGSGIKVVTRTLEDGSVHLWRVS